MKRSLLASLGMALAAAGCSKSVAVAVDIVSVSCTGQDVLAPDGGVQFLRFTVTVDGGATPPETVSVASQTLQFSQTPLGTVDIEVDAISENSPSATILAQGSSGPFDVDGSTSQQSVTVFLRAVDQSTPTGTAARPSVCMTMTQQRAYHSQALLPNGQVLIYGGVIYGATSPSGTTTLDWSKALAMPPEVASSDELYLATAEIYDPETGIFTKAGSWTPSAGTPVARTGAALIPFTNGDAVAAGGEGDPASDGVTGQGMGDPLVPAWNGGIFSSTASPAWSNTPTHSAHSHGCLAQDTAGDTLLTGGYTGSPDDTDQPTAVTTTASAEYFAPASWPPFPQAAGAFPENVGGPAGALADQACSGFDGEASLFQTLVAEVGGVWIDPAGAAMIQGTYYLEQFGTTTGDGGNFAPYTTSCGSSTCLLGNELQEARVRAKAARMLVTQATAAGGTATSQVDAVLVSGGFTCTPVSATECSVGDAGQLPNPPWTYFSNDGGVTDAGPQDVGLTTELINFPPSPKNPGERTVSQSIFSADMGVERIDHCAVPLPDGRVVLIGGLTGSTAATFGTTGSIEIAFDDPSTTPAAELPRISMHEAAGSLVTPRAGMACTLLPDGSILVTGGIETTGPLDGTSQSVKTLNSAEIYRPLPLAQE